MKKIHKFIIAIILILFFNCLTNNIIGNTTTSNQTSTSHLISSAFGIDHAQAANIISKTLNVNYTYTDAFGKEQQPQPWIFSIWRFSLSFVNIVLIIILLFLGTINILRVNYDTYEIKKMLLPLIIAVVLANFSMFICRALADMFSALSGSLGANYDVIGRDIANGLGVYIASDAATWMANTFKGAGTNLVVISSLPMLSIFSIFGIIMSILLAIVIFGIGLILYFRMVVIFFLAAVSPLAFIFMVLPQTQGWFRSWFKWYLIFLAMGPIIILILKIAAVLGATKGP